MKTAFITGIRQLEIGETASPRLERPGDAMIRIDAVGVCGSDLHYYRCGRIGAQMVKFPATVGHECAGTVIEVGASAGGLKTGQRIAIEPAMHCGRCDQCLSGRPHTCRHESFLGSPGEAPGAVTERLVIPASCCFPVPNSMSVEQAVMVEPFSIGLYAARMAGLEGRAAPSARIAVLGSGPIGLCVLLACRAEIPRPIYVTDLLPERLSLAARLGAVWTGDPRESDVVKDIAEREPLGVDFVFECAGQQETLDQAFEILKPGGTLLIVGIPEVDRVSFMIHSMRRKEITIRNVRRQNQCTAAAIDLIASRRVNVDPLVTHHFSMNETQSAFDTVASYQDGVVKAIIHVSGGAAG